MELCQFFFSCTLGGTFMSVINDEKLLLKGSNLFSANSAKQKRFKALSSIKMLCTG